MRQEASTVTCEAIGLRDEVDCILVTFSIVKRYDEVEFGEYRTKRVILERYEE
jgi:hypothetical protein